MSEPADQWPPPGTSLPIFDEADLHEVGWEAGTVTDGDYVDCTVIQAGRCGDHFAIVFLPGGHISCDENGHLHMDNVNFIGRGPLHHDPDCPAQRPDPEDYT